MIQIVDDLIDVKLSHVPADQHVPLREHMNEIGIKAIAQTSFGDYFDDEDKVKELRKNSMIVRMTFLYILIKIH